jgi:superfamily II DNA or RNA helicase
MVTFEIGNVYTTGLGIAEYTNVLQCLRTFVPGYRYTKLFKMRKWDGKMSLFSGETFPTGLLPDVLKKMDANKLPYVLDDKRPIRSITLRPTTLTLRPYQEDATAKAFGNMYLGTWWPRGVIKIPTGGGKTEIAAAMIQMANVPTMFLVHRQDLVRQAMERFQKYGIVVGELDTYDVNECTVCTVQSLMSWKMTFAKEYTNVEGKKTTREEDWLRQKKIKQTLRGREVIALLQHIEQVFIDEAHLIATDPDSVGLMNEALSLMPNAYMRWGLTATPFMREQLYDWSLEGATGPCIVDIPNRELIDAGYLSDCAVDMYMMPKAVIQPKCWPECYESGIVAYTPRNEKIIECLKNYPGPTLILVNKIGHGELLEAMAARAGKNIPFVSGTSSKAERNEVIDDVKSGGLDGIIASTIFDEGIDIPNIQTVILAGGGKSEIKNLQRVGRGLRKAHGKVCLQLVDFFDQGNKILKRHSVVRKEIWEAQGFVVTIHQ